jgi:hypothetical protein
MKMNKTEFTIALALLAGVIGLSTSARAQDVISKEVATEGSYCHMKFPAISKNTLSETAPSLTTSDDVIDFYGSCERSPLGEDEIQSQKRQWQHMFATDFED